MENGVNKPVEVGVDEPVEVRVGDEKVEERVQVGSDESEDVEEVFEEAVGTNDHALDQETKDASGDDHLVVGDSGFPVINDNSSVGGEMESFEEAPAVPGEARNVDEAEDEVEDTVEGESVNGVAVPDKIDEGGTVGEVVSGELKDGVEVPDKIDEGGTVGGEVSGKLNEGVVVSEVGARVESEVLKVGVESPENGDSDKVNFEESPVHAKLENGNPMGGKDREIELNGDILPADGESGELKEGKFVVESQDQKAAERIDSAAVSHMGLLDDKVEELNDKMTSLNEEHQINETEELRDATSGVGAAQANGVNGEVKDISTELDSEHQEEACKLEGTLADLPKDAVEGTVTPEIGGSPSLQKTTDEGNENIQVGTIDLSTDSQPQSAGEIVKEVHVGAEVPEKKAEKDREENQKSSQVIRECDIRPASEIASSTSSSTNPPPTHPASEIASSTSSSTNPPPNHPAAEIASSTSSSTNPPPKHPASEIASSTSSSTNPPPNHPAAEIASSTSSSTNPPPKHPASEIASSTSSSTNPPPNRLAPPAGLGRAAPLLEPAPRVVQQPRVNGAVSHTQTQQIEDPSNGETEEYDETREKLQMIRVKFLRLAHRLGQTPHNVVVAQVLYRLGLAEQLRGRNGGRVGAFSFDRASAMAEQLEAAGQEPLDFSCTIMVLGKSGVGKSATINSIFDEVMFNTDAFQMGTKKVQDVVGTVQGIRVRVIDTPGLLPSGSDQRQNEKILHSVKRFIKKTPPDIVLYLDRLDMQSRDFGDMPLLRTITEIFGPSIWFNAIVVLTHAASAPPDGPNGTASSYDMFVTQRSHVVQQAIRQAAGDMRLMNPVSLVENHSACRTNRAGQRVLPNGQVWKPHLLLLSFASKILAEANALLKLQDTPPGKPSTTRSRAPPLPFLLSSLLQSRPHVKLPEEQFGDEDSLDDELDESSESEDESELDELPPFKRLTKAQVAKLSRSQKKAYFDELEYREKLFMKKQLKEEKRRRKMMKKMAAAAQDLPSDYNDNVEEESGGAASVPVPMPDLALPASFDSDNPTHRYRYLDSSNQWLVRPVLETHGWDHDVGYEGINVERLFVVKNKIPVSFSGQVTKDKKDANVQMEMTSSLKHGEGKVTSLGFDMQTVGKDLAYTLRSETRFSNFRRNKATAGLSLTQMGDSLSGGMKVEDKLIVNKRFRVVMTGGAMTSRGDVAYGGSLEAQLRDKDYPLGRSLSTLGLSVMDWHGDLAIGCNIQSQVPIGRSTNMIARANLNNRGAGQVSIRFNSSEQLQLALIGLIPLLKKMFGYHQQNQFGQ
ncbi:translocase of chloroplast 120, chloroplastic-like [Pistacia vera]|uniref:translocase of chloroplast 120, chloroplastic-like n=1 Tax=Pistacia vera TaxID=55513 RepID=UPI001262D0B1|nr:translocase of chloroplast 120, chloroplastic-like [Pistacia vera]